MINDIRLVAKPTALQVPEDLAHNAERLATFTLELGVLGASQIEDNTKDPIPHITFYDADGNPQVAFLGEYLVKFDDFPEIQVYSEQRFYQMFQVDAPKNEFPRWATRDDDVYSGI